MHVTSVGKQLSIKAAIEFTVVWTDYCTRTHQHSFLNLCVVLRLPFSLSAFVSCRVVSGSRDATLRVWDIDSGQCLHVLMGHVAAVRCVQYDGRRVVSGAYDFMVKVWDPEMETCLHTLQGHTNRVYSLQVRPPTALKKRLVYTNQPWSQMKCTSYFVLSAHSRKCRVFENSYKNILVYDAMNQMQLVIFRSIYVRTRLTTLL